MPKYLTKVASGVKSVPQPDSAALKRVAVDVEFPSTALLVNDLIVVAELPIGVGLSDHAFQFPDVDSNGAPTFAFSFGVLNAGETDLATVYQSGITAGQSNAIVRAANSDAALADTSTVRKLAIKVTTAAATYNGAGKTGQVLLDQRG